MLKRLKVFKEDEFADLLHQCHNVIRNREKLDPAAAFDEIAKILFVKVYVERELRGQTSAAELFTVEYLDEQLRRTPARTRSFRQTKDAYADRQHFRERRETEPQTRDRPGNRQAAGDATTFPTPARTSRASPSSGSSAAPSAARSASSSPRAPSSSSWCAWWTPRRGTSSAIPASGSGGFLIRFFEIVREQILADADRQYQEYKAKIEADKKTLTETRRPTMLRGRSSTPSSATLDHDKPGSRLWKLANRCIYGTDANDRMARTSKMNMIMHGDGHGGVHHHDGFLNVNGIFEGRFDIILTNPPFGANVEPSDVVIEEQVDAARRGRDATTPTSTATSTRRRWPASAPPRTSPSPACSTCPRPRARTAKLGKIKTEMLFIERCLDLLKPGGRLGIVLPEGVFNNPSLAYVREFCENRAFIRAVVSSAPGDVLLFRREREGVVAVHAEVHAEGTGRLRREAGRRRQGNAREVRAGDRQAHQGTGDGHRQKPKEDRDADRRKALQGELHDYQAEMDEQIERESRALLKERFPYPIFLYEAEHVGITATGDTDRIPNELVPNEYKPAEVELTTLELYGRFKTDPKPFLAAGASE